MYGFRRGFRSTCWWVFGVALLVLLGAPSALAARPYPGVGDVRQAKQGKLSPRLLALSRAPLVSATAAAQAVAVSLPLSGPGSLVRSGRQVLVYTRVANTSDSTLAGLGGAGLRPTHVSTRYRVVTGFVLPSRLAQLASLAVVVRIDEVLAPRTARAGAPQTKAVANVGSFVSCGSKTSEGARQLAADAARSAFAVDGAGVKVGILSDSFDVAPASVTEAANDVASGDLPGPGNPCGRTTATSVISEPSSTSGVGDEGRAMAQIVHDLAPGSPLAFASAFNGLIDFADRIGQLRAAGAKVIVDDVAYFAEPMFQEGPVDVAISSVVADGALYFTAAGNGNLRVGGNNVGSYEAPAYRPTTCPAAVDDFAPYLDCHDFNPGAGVDTTDDLSVANGGGFIVNFQWAQPWWGVADDLDVFVIDASDNTVLAASFDDQTDGANSIPFEFFGWTNTTGATATVKIVLARWDGSPLPRLKFIMDGDGINSVQYNLSGSGDVVGPTIFGHSGSPDAFSVAAVPYDDRTTSEVFTSRGPKTLYYEPVVGSTAAAPLGAPEVVPVPHIAATDGGANTFFGSLVSGTYRFYGTSAAAPHAAAVAALMAQRLLPGSLSRPTALSAFQTTAHAVPNDGGATAVGAGLVDALGAVRNVVPFGKLRSYTTPVGKVPGNLLLGPSPGVLDWANQWAADWVYLPAGPYQLSATAVEGFGPPSPSIANIVANTDTVVELPFVTLGNLRVLTGPLDGQGKPPASTISIDGVRVNDYNFYAPFPAGAHTVCFGPVPGLNPPPCQNINVAADRTLLTTVNGVFTANAAALGESGVGFLRVVPQPAGAVPTVISINGQQRNQWALDWLKLPPGQYTLSYSDVEGFRAPAAQQVTIVADQVTTVTPSFTVLGNLRAYTNISPLSKAYEATIFLDGRAINNGSLWTPFPAGSHELCFGYVAGYVAPPCQTVNLVASRAALTEIQGMYTAG